MKHRYDEQEDDAIKAQLLKLTAASNAYLGELMYGKDEAVWEDARAALLENMLLTIGAVGYPPETIGKEIAELADFDQWWANRPGAPKKEGE